MVPSFCDSFKMGTSFVTLLAVASLASATFAPNYVACPSSNVLRQAGVAGPSRTGNQSLNTGETTYIQARKGQVVSELASWLGSRASAVYAGSLNSSTNATVPTIAIALSGGGDRAALYGAAVLAALDGRNAQSKTVGTGGYLQSSSYVSALSGGSWLLTSYALNDMPDAFDMVLGKNGTQLGWNLEFDLFSPSSNSTITTQYVQSLFQDAAAKKAAGFPVTVADIWALALSYHFVPGTNATNFFGNSTERRTSYRWSNVTSVPSYANNAMPFPIIVATVESQNATEMPLTGEAVPLQSVVYEISPLEFGSFDPELASFIPTELMGTAAESGTPTGGANNKSCVNNFDTACYVTGISSLLFHAYNVSNSVVWTSAISPLYQIVQGVNKTFGAGQQGIALDIAAVPNPFQGVNVARFEDARQTFLSLIDGGLAGEVDPIAPLAAPAREVDCIVVADASADSNQQMPTGASLVATEARSMLLANGSLALPPLPNSAQTFINLGLNTRPTFFGCGLAPANFTTANASVPSDYPLIVYLSNYDPTGVTNTSTGQTQYNVSQQVAFLTAAYNIATQGNSSEWGTCLQCAGVERMRARQGLNRTSTCEACFVKHCWNGTEAISNSSSGGNSSSGTGTNGTTGGSGTTPKSGAVTSFQSAPGVAALVALGLGVLVF
ncbi:BQ2448_5687 [Microbotryum intermedium]|uniref:Lysophospholipase n=1 Tax=Microbotryum intermedium TaxID=269621 RepID=A0A238F4V6_9BASI|nr:BQ2448_5687 [Microbotryum intermedium]